MSDTHASKLKVAGSNPAGVATVLPAKSAVFAPLRRSPSGARKGNERALRGNSGTESPVEIPGKTPVPLILRKKALNVQIRGLKAKLPDAAAGIQPLIKILLLHLESEIANARDPNAHLRAGTHKALDDLEVALEKLTRS